MARYRLNEAHFLNDKFYDAGAIVEWEGPPSRQMTPVEQVAEERKARYDEGRPHLRASRDILPRASMLHDPNARRPGMPRAAGPPGQTHPVESNPNNPVRTVEIAEATQEFHEQDAAARDDALIPQGDAPAPQAKPSRTRSADGDDHEPRVTRPKPSK